MKSGHFVLPLLMLFMLSIGQVHFLDAVRGDYLEVFVNYRNTGNDDVRDAQVTVIIPDLDIYERSQTLDVADNDHGMQVLLPYIPSYTAPGWYPMWTILSSDEGRTWQFDWLYIE